MTPVELAAEFEVTRGRVLDLVEQMSVCRALLALQRENAALRETLASFRRAQHHECDDCWYSCPEHPDYCGPRTTCDCGLREENARIDAALHGQAGKEGE